MGEVYRADDLKLSQPVALKFLPDYLLSDGAALARFHREVRVARQVSHRNVCRVYDIGEINGHQQSSIGIVRVRAIWQALITIATPGLIHLLLYLGWRGMKLDTRGRLLEFYAVPPQVDPVLGSEFRSSSQQNTSPTRAPSFASQDSRETRRIRKP